MLCHPVLLRHYVVGLHQRIEHRECGRCECRRGPVGSRPTVLNSSQPQNLLWYFPSDKSESSRAWKNVHSYASTFPNNAERYGVLSATAAFPASTSSAHRDHVQFCLYRPLVNSSTNLPCFSLPNADVTVTVSHSDYRSES